MNIVTRSGKSGISEYLTEDLNRHLAIIETLGEAVSNRFTENPSSGNSSTTYFTPLHDADGNTVLIRTSTGVWQITYNAENRPVRFENSTTETVITCAYDSQGRRFEKKVSVAGTTTSWERYLYRDYLQIAAFDVTEPESSSSSSEASGNSTDQLSTIGYTLKHIIYWDPLEPVATRPLAIFIANDQLYFPTIDLTKNVCELIDASGTLAATYDYAPFGAVTSTGTVANPLQWSSEIYDDELGLVYYNYRHYSPYDGRFLSRDPIEEQGGVNLYIFVKNMVLVKFDIKGKKCCLVTIRARWFQKEEYKSWGGHSIFTCGEGESTVGSAYVSYFPVDEENKEQAKHELADDAEKYGIDFSSLSENGDVQTTSKGFDVSQVCFSTDCVNVSKAARYIKDVFYAEGFEPWKLFGNNCANNAAAAIAAGLPPQKKPNCNRRCERVHDLLLTGVSLALPRDLEKNVKKMKANRCQRYICRRRPGTR